MILHYGRDGQPIGLQEWAAQYLDPLNLKVEADKVGPVAVSTIWTGIPDTMHSIAALLMNIDRAPLIFETVTFTYTTGHLDGEMEGRYPTEPVAKMLHEQTVSRLCRVHDAEPEPIPDNMLRSVIALQISPFWMLGDIGIDHLGIGQVARE